MAYSVMIWLVDNDEEGVDTDASPSSRQGNGARAGVTAPPPFSHLAYGVYDSQRDVREALTRLTNELGDKGVVRVDHGSRTFLIPTSRVHYVVCEEVERPVDRDQTD